jgi:hypothetical protein
MLADLIDPVMDQQVEDIYYLRVASKAKMREELETLASKIRIRYLEKEKGDWTYPRVSVITQLKEIWSFAKIDGEVVRHWGGCGKQKESE